MIRDVVVPVPKDASHKHGRDSATIVRLRCEIDYCDNGSDENVQAGSSHASGGADIDREPDEVFDRSTTVEYHEDGENERADHSGDYSMPP